MIWAVSNAPLARPCQWPSVAAFRVGQTKCSATLVHPRVIVTAAHCLEAGDPGRVRFGEDFSPYARRFDVQQCTTNEPYFETRSPSDDFAACILAEPVDDVPIVPVAMGCDTAALQPGTTAAIVGFGQPALMEDFGRKHVGLTAIADIERPDGLIAVGDQATNGCLGDSGGPGFVQLPDDSWRAFGILVAGPECGAGPSTFLRIDAIAEWVYARTNIDITPCHDASGEFVPGNACGEFATAPDQSDSTWDVACTADGFAPTAECPDGLSFPEPTPTPTQGSSDDGQTGSESTGSFAASTGESGCACSTQKTDHWPWSALLLAIVLWRRTRQSGANAWSKAMRSSRQVDERRPDVDDSSQGYADAQPTRAVCEGTWHAR